MDPDRHRVVAGVSLVAAGALLLLGITAAEALFPGYSTSGDTISALGSDRATAGSAAVFNSVMVVAGLLAVTAAYGLHGVYGRGSLTGMLAVTGVGGFVGVGVFPAGTGLLHFVAAMIAFAGVGLTAVVVAATVRGPFRYVSAVLGVLELIALVLFVALGGSTPLGIGGLERWVAYLGLVWAVAFGGVLLADGSGGG